MTNEACDGVVCSLLGYEVEVTTLPCNATPAISVVVKDSNDIVIVKQIVDRTQQLPLVGGIALLITVQQLTGAIGLGVWIV